MYPLVSKEVMLKILISRAKRWCTNDTWRKSIIVFSRQIPLFSICACSICWRTWTYRRAIALEFEDGYEKLTEPFEQVEGNITIEGVDFDCTCVMLQSKWGNYGKFNGEKLELEHFIKRYKNYSFEIVDELYGYNQVLYSGYLSILETEDLVQMDISIYFTGKIIYDTKE